MLNEYLCGNGGCPWAVVEGRRSTVIGELFAQRILVLAERKKGYRVLVCEFSMGQAENVRKTYEMRDGRYKDTENRKRRAAAPTQTSHPVAFSATTAVDASGRSSVREYTRWQKLPEDTDELQSASASTRPEGSVMIRTAAAAGDPALGGARWYSIPFTAIVFPSRTRTTLVLPLVPSWEDSTANAAPVASGTGPHARANAVGGTPATLFV